MSLDEEGSLSRAIATQSHCPPDSRRAEDPEPREATSIVIPVAVVSLTNPPAGALTRRVPCIADMPKHSRAKRSELSFEPVMCVELVVERLDLDVPGLPIHSDGLGERTIRLQPHGGRARLSCMI